MSRFKEYMEGSSYSTSKEDKGNEWEVEMNPGSGGWKVIIFKNGKVHNNESHEFAHNNKKQAFAKYKSLVGKLKTIMRDDDE